MFKLYVGMIIGATLTAIIMPCFMITKEEND